MPAFDYYVFLQIISHPINVLNVAIAFVSPIVCRYPNIACELLTSDVSQITESLTTDPKLLDKIMLFVDTDGLLNPLQTSFFSKVVGLLITRKSEVVRIFICR